MTHQCFLTNRGLYLLVWNVKDGQAGIESLSIWLQNLQVSILSVHTSLSSTKNKVTDFVLILGKI